MALNYSLFPLDFQAVGESFVSQYYAKLQQNRQFVLDFYHEQALMTYEGTPLNGRAAIMGRFQSLTWKTIQINITSCDCQPMENGIVVFVDGQLRCDDEARALPFSECFVLKKMETSYCITNSVFRLHLHNF
uniref:NTF2-related export protein n=1 Tax=Schistocephalus solidus TaxID=70667 RepID=A0A0X3NWP2_SCHSO